MSDPGLCWRPLLLRHPEILTLQLGYTEIARVQEGRSGEWHSSVGMHRMWEERRRLVAIAPSMAIAQKWAERWSRANLARIVREIEAEPRPRHIGTG